MILLWVRGWLTQPSVGLSKFANDPTNTPTGRADRGAAVHDVLPSKYTLTKARGAIAPLAVTLMMATTLSPIAAQSRALERWTTCLRSSGLGIPDFDNVMAGVNYAIAEGYSDSARLGVGGWSDGGILTNYVITKTDRFAGATPGASMALLVVNFGHDHYQLVNEREWGLPWESRELWEDSSPFSAIEKVVTPTLIMGGEQDWNVPIQNSEQLYQALRRRDVPTQLVVYPGQPHGLRVPSYQKDRLERYVDWYDKWVKKASKPVTD